MAIQIKVNDNLGKVLFDSCAPALEYGTQRQAVDNETKQALWNVHCFIRQEQLDTTNERTGEIQQTRGDQFNVRVPAMINPAETIGIFDPVAFDNLTCTVTTGRDGSTRVAWAADGIHEFNSPALKPATKPVEAK